MDLIIGQIIGHLVIFFTSAFESSCPFSLYFLFNNLADDL